jgi:hypothetical protein
MSTRLVWWSVPMPYLFALLIVIGGPVLLVQYLTGMPLGYAAVTTAVLVVVGIAAMVQYAKKRKAERRIALITKYGSPDEADMIMDRKIWSGMSSEQLLDSLGKPEGIDHMVNVRKSREVWKYDRVGQNRYRNRVTVDNGRVAGWTAKGG